MALTLEIEIPAAVSPGETVKAVVVATTPDARTCPNITVRLVGEASYGEESRTICEKEGVHEIGTLPAGVTRLETSFRLPDDALPTFGKGARVSYVVSAEADLPWSRDVRAEVELTVCQPPPADLTPGMTSARASSSTKRLGKRAPSMVVRLEEQVVGGLTLRGSLELAATQGKVSEIHAVVVGLLPDGAVAEETRHAPIEGPLARGPFADGVTYELAIPIEARGARAQDWHAPSFTGRTVSLTHEVRVVAEQPPLPPLSATLPLRVHAQSAASREQEAAERDARRRAARLAAWDHVLAELDTESHVASADEAGGRFELVRGTARIRITGELTKERGPILRAELGWDALGVGLRVQDAGLATFGGISMRGELTDRCRVTMRTGEQVKALLSEPLKRILVAFSRVDLHDRGGVVESVGGLQSKADLTGFARRCLALQKSIRIRRKLVPLHPAVLPLETAYARFARRRQAAIAPGDLSIDKREPGSIGWSLRLRFGADALSGSEVYTELDEGLELQSGAHELAAKRLGHPVARVGRNLCMSLPLATDPATIETLIDSFVDTTRTLTVGGSRGPYR